MNTKYKIVFAVISLFLSSSFNAYARQAPSFALLNSKGAMVYKNDLKGNLVISFFASYCRPCKKELPALADLVKKYERDKQVTLVLIATDSNDQSGEALDKARKFLKNIGVTREFLLDIYQVTVAKYSPEKIVPATFLVNSQGWIVFHEIGARDDTVAKLEKQIQLLR